MSLFFPLSIYPIKTGGQIARSFRKNDEQEGDSNLRPPGFDFRIWAFKNMLSKRQNQEPGVVAIFTRKAEHDVILEHQRKRTWRDEIEQQNQKDRSNKADGIDSANV